MTLTCGSLFAGIGGFDLGFERAGIKTIWQVEIDEYCRRVLAKHFPRAKQYPDVRSVGLGTLVPVEIICGGFPCQDISNCGTKRGLDGDRSGLWSEMHRIIGELRPRYIVVENVAALIQRGIDRVCGDLAELGYDTEWQSFSAQDFGAPHLRPRIFIVGYPNSFGLEAGSSYAVLRQPTTDARNNGHTWATSSEGMWEAEMPPKSSFCGVADGLPFRLDRLKSLGNAIVPQIAEWIGRRIVEAEVVRANG